ncbi:uncharacterized protein LOC125665371 [Ostrea edulis]|uniref:uncharacterized protein LOC125665371 n=1 Tax=Ostrea edulis TaxID=37623 RepID=UPI0024AF68FD|nr:uncharacterized protein LOC125665371 [Ostrea edulis]
MESDNLKQYQQACIVPTTKLKKKPSDMLHIPSQTKSISQFQLFSLQMLLSVLQGLTNNKLPSLEQALFNIQSRITVLQWIPSHCGVYGNEQADILAKQGAGQQQEETPVCLAEMKTIIKSLYRKSKHQDSYHHLSRPEQTVIFRLRTGHNRLNKHLNRVMKVVPSRMCPCGEAEQDTTHILQTCKNHQTLR